MDLKYFKRLVHTAGSEAELFTIRAQLKGDVLWNDVTTLWTCAVCAIVR